MDSRLAGNPAYLIPSYSSISDLHVSPVVPADAVKSHILITKKHRIYRLPFSALALRATTYVIRESVCGLP
jgi:hypothetical protein